MKFCKLSRIIEGKVIFVYIHGGFPYSSTSRLFEMICLNFRRIFVSEWCNHYDYYGKILIPKDNLFT